MAEWRSLNVNPIDVDTVIVVSSDGVDVEYNTKTHPGMGGYLVPGLKPGEYTIWLTIPINRRKDESAGTDRPGHGGQ